MRFCRPAITIATLLSGAAAFASVELVRPQPDTVIFAMMSGKCNTLKVAGRDFRCRAVAFFQTEEGRANFTVALDDPADDNHVISFSGEYGHRTQDNLYVLAVDRMLLSNKSRPKADGLPIPSEVNSDGVCRQLGKFAAREVSNITCSATDKVGKKYELTFESDGTPITLRRIRMSAPTIRLQDPYR